MFDITAKFKKKWFFFYNSPEEIENSQLNPLKRRIWMKSERKLLATFLKAGQSHTEPGPNVCISWLGLIDPREMRTKMESTLDNFHLKFNWKWKLKRSSGLEINSWPKFIDRDCHRRVLTKLANVTPYLQRMSLLQK